MRALFIEHDHISLGGPIWRSLEKHGYEIERFLIVPEENFSTPNVHANFPNFLEYDLLVPMGAPYGAYENTTGIDGQRQRVQLRLQKQILQTKHL